jgi:hypothetical protein
MAVELQPPTDKAKEVVLALGQALNDADFQTAREYLSDDLKYIGVFGARDGAEAYLQDMKRLRLKFGIKKIFVDSEDICVLYDLAVSSVTLFACGWFQIKEGKVSSLRVVFDPRPILELAGSHR